MPFESISSDASQQEASAWSMRMMRQGYGAAGRLERAMRVVRDCQHVKDPLKIADRFLVAYHDLVCAAAEASSHPDPVYRLATTNALRGFTSQIETQVPLCLDAFMAARKDALEQAKGGKRQYAIAMKSLETLRKYGDKANWQSIPEMCRSAFLRTVQYWADQSGLLSKYVER
jgi:hypothetical protein